MSNRNYPHFTNLLFACPMTGRPIPPQVMFAFHSMALPMNYSTSLLQIYKRPIDEARNAFAEQALAMNCKYLFFWDEDVACPPHTIPELIFKMEHYPDIAVVGGVYCLKRRPPEPLLFRGNGNGPFWDWKAGEFFEVSGIGMGCTLIRTEVFKDLKKPWFKTEFNYAPMMDGVPSMESWTEDLWFTKRVTDTNKWKIYADTSLLCSHYDMATCEPYDLPSDSKPVKHLQVPKGKKKILDIGSGGKPFPTNEGTVITADLEEAVKPDYRCDLRRLPFDSKLFDIAHSGALETFAAYEAPQLVKEWARVVKPGGELRLVVGDIKALAKEVAGGKLPPSTLYTPTRLSAYTEEDLTQLMLDAGISTVKRAKSDPAHIALKGVLDGA